MWVERVGNGYWVKDWDWFDSSKDRCQFISEWNTGLSLMSLMMEKEDLFEVLEDKKHEHYYQANEVKSRHLRRIKDDLKQQLREGRKKPIFTLSKTLRNRIDPIQLKEGIIHKKTVEIYCSMEKKESIFFVEVSPETEKKVEEYNRKRKEFLDYQRSAMIDIFGEEQLKGLEEPFLFLWEKDDWESENGDRKAG
jgi:hypothetical protein